jgi:hypothetical protein
MSSSHDNLEIEEAITRYVQSIPVPERSMYPRQNRWLSFKPVTIWRVLIALVVMSVVFVSADDVMAFYQQVFVTERSQRVSRIEFVLQRAPFQVWAPDGQLIEVQDLGSETTYSVLSRYLWKDTFEIVMMQDAGTIIPSTTHTSFWEGARILDDDITIQEQPAVIYETPVIGEQGTILRWSRKLYVILDGTAIVLFGVNSPALSQEELIAIGESLKPLKP